jgi:protein gp37
MTAIEWTDAVWNPTTGCDRVSPGCDHCYALTMAKRLKGMGQAKYQNDGDPRTSGPGFALTTHMDTLDLPLRWRKPQRVFVNSMSDLFHPDVPDEFIGAVIQVMTVARHHTFQVLTKRPQRAQKLLRHVWWDLNGDSHLRRFTAEELGVKDENFAVNLSNVWLGTSIESDRYTFRADHLRNTPAAIRFLSLEPLLGPLPSLDLTGIDWVIVGGESGPGARPMDVNWVREIRDQCLDARVPFFFKQWGAWAPTTTDDGYAIRRIGKKAAGRTLDGRTWDQYPAEAR